MDIKQFSGLANKVAQEAIPLGALTAATNTDIDNAGKLRRRRGTTLISAGGFHSLFAVSDTEGYAVKDGDLCRFSQSMALDVIAQGVGDDPLSYVRVGDRIYAKSRTQALTFAAQGMAQQWGVPLVPGFAVAPIGSATVSARLVALTYRRDSDGLEGGVVDTRIVYGDAVAISSIPTVSGHTASIYMTAPNGETLLLAAEGVIGAINVYPDAIRDVPLRTLNKTPPTGPGPLAWLFGRILLADGNVLWETDPYQYELVDAVGGYKLLESEITFLGGVSDGVFIGTQTGVFFMGGTFDAAQLTRVSTRRAPNQQPQQIDMSDVLKGDAPGVGVLFLTDGGVCVGMPGGQLVNLTNKIFEFPKAESMSVMVRAQDGMNQFVGVASHPGSPTGSARFGDFVDAEIVRFRGN
jgi:hypothetical protein